MTNFTWTAAGGGDWTSGADWDRNIAPNGPTADATLGITGTYAVTISNTDPAYTVDSLTLNDPGATFVDAGTLTLAGVQALLALDVGTFDLTGTLNGGTIDITGGQFDVPNSGTLNDLSINLGLAGAFSGADAIVAGAGQTLTLASTVSLTVNGLGFTNEITGGTIVNDGFITIEPFGYLDLQSQGFVNVGTIATSSYDSVEIFDTFDNIGLLSIASGGDVFIHGAFSNSGTIALNGGLALETDATLQQLGTIAGGSTGALYVDDTLDLNGGTLTLGAGGVNTLYVYGTVENGTVIEGAGSVTIEPGGTLSGVTLVQPSTLDTITGTDNLGGGTLDIAPGTTLSDVLLDGTLANGTLILDGGTFAFGSGAALNDMVFRGELDLSGTGTTVSVSGGLTLESASGSTPGTINLTGSNSALLFLDSETLDNVAIAFGSQADISRLGGPQSGTLTLGKNVSLTSSGSAYFSGDDIVNEGTLSIAAGGISFTAIGFSNQGTIITSGTGSLAAAPLEKNSGLISIGTGSRVFFNGSGNSGTIDVAAGGTLLLLGAQSLASLGAIDAAPGGVVEFTGTLDLAGGTLDVAPGTEFGVVAIAGEVKNGTIKPDGGNLIVAPGATVDAITYLGPLNLNVANTSIDVLGGLTVESATGGQPGTINVTGSDVSVSFLDSETLDNVTIAIKAQSAGTAAFNEASGDTLTLGGNAILSAATGLTLQGGAVVNEGTFVANGGTFTDDATSFTNDGTALLSGGIFTGGTLTDSGLIVGSGTIASATILTGTIEAQGGLLTIGQTVQAPANIYTGFLQIDAGATLELANGSGPGIVFNGAGATLQLDAPGANTGTFTGLAAGDTLVLQGVTASDAHAVGNLLTVDLSGGTSLEYSLAAPLAGIAETTAAAGGGSEVSFVLPCFLRGTLIATTAGDIAVEKLAVGDHVITASGAARRVRWLGHRSVDCTRIADPLEAWPVLVRQGAFGTAMPARDLWLSPEHAIAAEDALMPAKLLQNGRTIVQTPRPSVEYWHVELDSHDIILAEGLPVETFLDSGNRHSFVGGADHAARHPDLRPSHWTQTCRPLRLEGPAVAAAKAHLLRRAAALGHTLTADAALHILADGRRIPPVWLSETRAAFMLPAGCREVSLQSRSFMPSLIDPHGADERKLGICVSRLQLDGTQIDLADEATFAAGWHRLEDDGAGYRQRWTEGAARLPAGAMLVVLDIGGPGQYWDDADETAHTPGPAEASPEFLHAPRPAMEGVPLH